MSDSEGLHALVFECMLISWVVCSTRTCGNPQVPSHVGFSFPTLSFPLTSKHLVSFPARENPGNSSIVCLSFSLASPGFSEIPLPHSKQEVSAGSCTNGTVLCGMSPIVTGTKVSWNKDKDFKSAIVRDPSVASHCIWGVIEWIGSLQEYT